VRVFGSPLDKFLVLAEDGVDQLIEHVIGGLAEKRGVRVQCLSVFSVESRDVPQDLFATRSRFDQRHPTLLVTLKCVRNDRPDRAQFAQRFAR
jgi:hypothetical protein